MKCLSNWEFKVMFDIWPNLNKNASMLQITERIEISFIWTFVSICVASAHMVLNSISKYSRKDEFVHCVHFYVCIHSIVRVHTMNIYNICITIIWVSQDIVFVLRSLKRTEIWWNSIRQTFVQLLCITLTHSLGRIRSTILQGAKM